jgi:hypothetical protein
VKFIPHRNGGDSTPIEAKKFKHWIGTVEHWFCVHESLDMIGKYTVSDWDSGYKVMDVPYQYLMVCLNDTKAAARLTLNRLIESRGESRVLEVLRNAPKKAKQ